MKRVPPHPLFFAAYPALHLYAANVDQVALKDLLLAVAVLVPVALAANLALGLLLRDSRRGALALTATIAAFFSYGSVLTAVQGLSFGGLAILGHTTLLLVYAVALIAVIIPLFFLRTRALGVLTLILDVCSTSLVILAVAAAVWTGLHGLGGREASRSEAKGSDESTAPPGGPRDGREDAHASPDIYYIILDGYARDDTLRDHYGFDNSPFLDWLASRGFFVARDSSPNYSSTLESVSSALNMRYLEASRGEAHPGRLPAIRATLQALIQDSEGVRFLRRRGYRLFAFDSGLSSTSIHKADVFLRPSYGLSEFHVELIGMTMLSAVQRLSKGLHAARIRYILGELPQLAEIRGPKFVFAHLLVPHPPYVFNADGQPVDDGVRFSFRWAFLPQDVYIRRYTDQVRFTNDQVQQVVEGILDRSASPPIVIIQGDHGPGFNCDGDCHIQERIRILNAYYLPGGGSEGLYSTISPVNTFRYIFDRYFGAEFDLLRDGYVVSGQPTLFPQADSPSR